MPKFQKMVVLHKNSNGEILTAKTVGAGYELSDFLRGLCDDIRTGDFIDFSEAGRRAYEKEDDGSAANEPDFAEVESAPVVPGIAEPPKGNDIAPEALASDDRPF